MSDNTAIVFGGIPQTNMGLYHRIRFLVGDPTAVVTIAGRTIFILRDIEMGRARQHSRADEVACPADYAPEAGLSGDRETATAQATAECLRRNGVTHVTADRSLPLIYAHHIQEAGIALQCDLDLGVLDRRAKDEQEIAWLREAQKTTEEAMKNACSIVAKAEVAADGTLIHNGSPLTADGLRFEIESGLSKVGYSTPFTIVACGPQAADCHERGEGTLRTEQPVIVDIFPQNRDTLYNGDCTRTVVHGKISAEVERMHAAVVYAKQQATAATRPGATGEDVHAATTAAMKERGFEMGLPPEGVEDWCRMTHGTGHGIGLDVHEPPLLDRAGPPLVKGDALTIEPGLYSPAIGGVRVEDMVVVTDDGCENLNQLPEGLEW